MSMKNINAHADLAQAKEARDVALKKLASSSDYLHRKMSRRLATLEEENDVEEVRGDVPSYPPPTPPPPPARATLPTWPDEHTTVPDHHRRLA